MNMLTEDGIVDPMPHSIPRGDVGRLHLSPNPITGAARTDRILTDLTVDAFERFRRERAASLDAYAHNRKVSGGFHRAMARTALTELRIMLKLLNEIDNHRFGQWQGCVNFPCGPHDMTGESEPYNPVCAYPGCTKPAATLRHDLVGMHQHRETAACAYPLCTDTSRHYHDGAI